MKSKKAQGATREASAKQYAPYIVSVPNKNEVKSKLPGSLARPPLILPLSQQFIRLLELEGNVVIETQHGNVLDFIVGVDLLLYPGKQCLYCIWISAHDALATILNNSAKCQT